MKNLNTHQKLFINSFSGFINNFIKIVLGAFMGIYLVRYLGPENLGKYSYVTSVVSLIFMMLNIGLSTFLIRETSMRKSDEEVDCYLGSAVMIQLFLSLVAFIILFFVVYFVSDHKHYAYFFLVAALGSAFNFYNMPFNSIINGYQKIYIVSTLETIRTIINFLMLFLVFFILKKGVIYILICSTISNGVLLILSLFYLISMKIIPVFKVDYKMIKKVFFGSITFGLIGILGYIFSQLDILFIKHFLDFQMLGYYTAILSLINLVIASLVSATSILLPFLSRNFETKKYDTKYIINKSINYILLMVFLWNILVFIWGHDFISLLYGQRYLAGLPVMYVLSLSLIPIGINIILQNVLFSHKQEQFMLAMNIVNIIISILINIIFLPRIGILASAISIFINQGVFVIFSYLTISRVLNFSIFSIKENIFVGMFSIVIVGIFKYLIHFSIFTGWLFVIPLFVILAILFKVLGDDELVLIKKISGI